MVTKGMSSQQMTALTSVGAAAFLVLVKLLAGLASGRWV
jgi:hypothetical protein